jgi:hypothetical protein
LDVDEEGAAAPERVEAMKEKPILYSAPMVVAKRAGRKTQTRRIIKLKRPLWGDHYLQAMWGRSPPPDPVDFGTPGLFREVGPDYPDSEKDDVMAPYVPGDLLWGREAWRVNARFDPVPPRDLPREVPIEYIADGTRTQYGRYRNGRFMMRWMSRILDEVVSVRVERLHEISAADALAEGLEEVSGLGVPEYRWPGGEKTFLDPRDCYLAGWDTINGAGAAALNPWVWVIETRPVTR